MDPVVFGEGLGNPVSTCLEDSEESWRGLASGREEATGDAGEAGRNKVWIRSLRLGAVRGSDSQLSQTGKLQRSHQLEAPAPSWHWVSPPLQSSRGGHGVRGFSVFWLGRQGAWPKCNLGREELSFRGRPGLPEDYPKHRGIEGDIQAQRWGHLLRASCLGILVEAFSDL